MEFMDSLSKRIGEMAKQVEEKSGEWLEIGKINLELFREEEAIRKLCRKIGESVYEAYSHGEVYGSKVDENCREIGEKKLKILLLKQQIEEIKKAEKNTQESEQSSATHGFSKAEGFSEGEPCPACGVQRTAKEKEPLVCEVE